MAQKSTSSSDRLMGEITLNENLKRLRKERHLNQIEFCKEFYNWGKREGYNIEPYCPNTVSVWESKTKNKFPPITVVVLLSKFYGVTIDKLLFGNI